MSKNRIFQPKNAAVRVKIQRRRRILTSIKKHSDIYLVRILSIITIKSRSLKSPFVGEKYAKSSFFMLKILKSPISRPKSFFFSPLRSFSQKGPEIKKNPLKRFLNKEFLEIFNLCKPESKGFVYGTILTFASSAIFMLFPQALSQITSLTSEKYEIIDKEKDDTIQKQEKNTKNKEITMKYVKFLGLWITIFGLSGVITYVRRYISNDLANRIACRLRQKVYSVILQKNYSFFNSANTSVASLVHKITNDITAISNTISVDLVFGIRGVFFIIGGSLYLIVKIPEWTLMSLGTMSFLVYLSKIIGKKLRNSKQEEVEALAKLGALANERLSSIKLIKISNTEKIERDIYENQLYDFYRKSRNVSKYQGLNHGVLDGLGQVSLICILTYGAYLVSIGIGSPQMLTSSIYALYVGLGFRSLIVVYTELTKVTALYAGIFDLIGSIKSDETYNHPQLMLKHDLNKDLVEKPEERVTKKHIEHPPSITFEGVDFTYPERNLIVLKSLSMDIQPQEIVCIEGESGSGKSTILNLLCKLYDPDSGRILIDGEDLKLKDQEWVQQNIAYVTQDPILFMGSIYENIIYGNQGFDVSMENAVKCAKIANAHEFIEKLDQGYLTMLSEKGGNLSGGQRQRLILARVLMKNPRIIILDEATSALDPESERQIVSELKEICKGRTCIIITHKFENYRGLVNRVIRLK